MEVRFKFVSLRAQLVEEVATVAPPPPEAPTPGAQQVPTVLLHEMEAKLALQFREECSCYTFDDVIF